MRELATYVGGLLIGLNAISLVSIFFFDYYEGVLGGRWDNAWLGALVSVPIVIAMALGYAAGAFVRDRRRPPPARPYVVGAIGALISAALVFGTPVVEAVTPSAWFGVGVIAAYLVLVGFVAPWIAALGRRNVASAA
jgi:hypothetical protein